MIGSRALRIHQLVLAVVSSLSNCYPMRSTAELDSL